MVDVVFQLMTFMLFSIQLTGSELNVPEAKHGVGVDEGSATLVCGAEGEAPVTCTFTAVLAEMPSCSFYGTRTETQFVLRGGAITVLSGGAASGVDGATLVTAYDYPSGGTVDGGNMADALLPVGLNLDGGNLG